MPDVNSSIVKVDFDRRPLLGPVSHTFYVLLLIVNQYVCQCRRITMHLQHRLVAVCCRNLGADS